MELDYFPNPTVLKVTDSIHPITHSKQIFIAYHGYVVNVATGKGISLDDFELLFGGWEIEELPWKSLSVEI